MLSIVKLVNSIKEYNKKKEAEKRAAQKQQATTGTAGAAAPNRSSVSQGARRSASVNQQAVVPTTAPNRSSISQSARRTGGINPSTGTGSSGTTKSIQNGSGGQNAHFTQDPHASKFVDSPQRTGESGKDYRARLDTDKQEAATAKATYDARKWQADKSNYEITNESRRLYDKSLMESAYALPYSQMSASEKENLFKQQMQGAGYGDIYKPDPAMTEAQAKQLADKNSKKYDELLKSAPMEIQDYYSDNPFRNGQGKYDKWKTENPETAKEWETKLATAKADKTYYDTLMQQYGDHEVQKETAAAVRAENPNFNALPEEQQNDIFTKKYYELQEKKYAQEIAGLEPQRDENMARLSDYTNNPFVQFFNKFDSTGMIKAATQAVSDDPVESAYMKAQAGLSDVQAQSQQYEQEQERLKALKAFQDDAAKNSDFAALVEQAPQAVPDTKGLDKGLYKYINDIDNNRAQTEINFMRGGGENPYYEYSAMTDEEIRVYNYYVLKGQVDKAEEYLDTLRPVLERRNTEKAVALNTSIAEEHPALASGVSAVLTLGEGVGYVESLIRKVAGEDVDANGEYFRPSAVKEAIRGEVSSQIESGIGKKAYDIGMSIVDSALSVAVGGGAAPLSLGLMGTGAAANTTRDAKLRGATDEQALGLGAVAGVIEVLTEKIPLDNFLSMAKGDKLSFLNNVLQQAGIEATEETISEVTNILADGAIMGDLSNFSISVNDYMAQGLSYNEAVDKTNEKIIKQIMDAAVGGGISGTAFGAAGSIIGGVKNNQESRAASRSLDNSYTDMGVYEALNNPQTVDMEQQQLTQQYTAAGAPPIAAEVMAAADAAQVQAQMPVRTTQDITQADFNAQGNINPPAMQTPYAGTQVNNADVDFTAQAQQVKPLADAAQTQLIGNLHQAFDGMGFEVIDPGAKSVESLANKVSRKQAGGDTEYDIYTPKDHARASLMMNSVEDIPVVMDGLRKLYPGLAAEFKHIPATGYLGFHVTMPAGNGLNAEVQLTLPGMFETKKASDAVYDKWRNAKESELTPSEIRQRGNDYKASRAIWESYFEKSGITPEVMDMASSSLMGVWSGENTSPADPSLTQSPLRHQRQYRGDSRVANNMPPSNMEKYIFDSTMKSTSDQSSNMDTSTAASHVDSLTARENSSSVRSDGTQASPSNINASAPENLNTRLPRASQNTDFSTKPSPNSSMEQKNGNVNDAAGKSPKQQRQQAQNEAKRAVREGTADVHDIDAVVAAEREAADAEVSRQKGIRAKEAQRRRESGERSDLLKIVRRLDRLKTAPGNRALIESFIEDIDKTAKGITDKNKITLETLRKEYTEAMKDADALPNRLIEEKINRLDNMQIADMDINDVRTLTDVLRGIEHDIKTANMEIGKEKNRKIAAVAADVMAEVHHSKGFKGIENTAGIPKNIRDFFAIDALRPKTFFGLIGGFEDGATQGLYTDLNNGQIKALEFQKDAAGLFVDFIKENGKLFDRWTGKKAEWIDTGISKGGIAVRLTPAMRISLYLHSLNDQNLRHIGYGGITIPNQSLYRKGAIAESYTQGKHVTLTPTEVKHITDDMTAPEKEFAGIARRFFDGLSKNAMNETSLLLNGYEIANVDGYMPINTDKRFVPKDIEALVKDGTIEGMGILKERILNSANPVLLEDITGVVMRQIDAVSKYVGLAVPIRNFNRVYNSFADGYETGVKTEIGQKWGGAATKYIENLLTDLQTTKTASSGLDRLRGNFAQAVLAFNPSVTLKQAASYPQAASTVGWSALGKGFFRKVDTDIINQYTPLYWYRSQGNATVELGDVMSRKGWAQKVPFLMNWIQKMDMATTHKLWGAAEVYTERTQPGLKRGTDEYYRAVAETYNHIIEDTQPNYTKMQRSGVLRSDNQILRAVTMFSTQRNQNFNIAVEALGRQAAAQRTYNADKSAANFARLKNARTGAARAVSSIAVSSVVLTAITAVVAMAFGRGWKYEDDEGNVTLKSLTDGLLDDFMNTVTGNIFFGDKIYGAISATIQGNKWYEMEVPEIQVLNELVTGANDFAQTLSAYQNGIKDIKDTGGDPVEYANANAASVLKSIKGLSMSIATMFGIPAENIEKYVIGLAGQVSPAFKTEYDNLTYPVDVNNLKGAADLDAAWDIVMRKRLPEMGGTEAGDELKRLYKAALESDTMNGNDIFQPNFNGKLTLDKVEYELNAGEKQKYEKARRAYFQEHIGNVVQSDIWDGLADAERLGIVDDLNTIASSVAKAGYFAGKGKEYKPEAWIGNALSIAGKGGDLAQYLALRNMTGAVQGDPLAFGDDKTAEHSASLKKKDIIDAYVTDEDERQGYYEMLGVGKDVASGKVTFEDVAAKDAGAKAVIATLPESAWKEYRGTDWAMEAEKTEETADTLKKRWAAESITTDEGAKAFWEYFMEPAGTEQQNTIAYAQEMGVSPLNYIKREAQRTAEKGDRDTKETVVLNPDGSLATEDKEYNISGTQKREAMKSLLTSGYSDDEKKYFYGKEFGTDSGWAYAMAASIPVDEYLKLKRDDWNIQGEKDKNGKTISGTKKKAYYEYVDGLALTQPQKDLLIALTTTYKIDGGAMAGVKSYVDTLDIDAETRRLIYEKIGLSESGGTGSGSGRSGGRRGGSGKGKAGAKAEYKQAKTVPVPKGGTLSPAKGGTPNAGSGYSKRNYGSSAPKFDMSGFITGKYARGNNAITPKDTITEDAEHAAREMLARAFEKRKKA